LLAVRTRTLVLADGKRKVDSERTDAGQLTETSE